MSVTRAAFDGRTKDALAAPTLTHTGSTERLGYSVGYESTLSKGFRDNDYKRTNILSTSMQYQLSKDDVLILDAGGIVQDSGDTELGVDPNLNNSTSSSNLDDGLVRLGFNHRFGPGTILIGQGVANHSNLRQKDTAAGRLVAFNFFRNGEFIEQQQEFLSFDQRTQFTSDALRFDTQLLHQSEDISAIIGLGLSQTHLNQDESALFRAEDGRELPLTSQSYTRERGDRYFSYITAHPLSWMDLHTGASLTHLTLPDSPVVTPFLEGESKKSRLSPKGGVTLFPAKGLVLRGAYFETLGTSGIRDLESIEPTLFAGFNQLFSDIYPATIAKNYGLGFDHRVRPGLYLGGEFIHRDLTRSVPLPVSALGINLDDDTTFMDVESAILPNDRTEDFGRGYLNIVLSDRATGVLDRIIH